MAVNEPAQKAEPFGYVTAVVSNVILREAHVNGQKLGHVDGLREEVSRVAQLRRLHDHGPLKIEYVFRPKQVNATSTHAELLVIERVVVWLPGNQRDIDIPRHS